MAFDPRIIPPVKGQRLTAQQLGCIIESADANIARFGPGVVGSRRPGGVSLWTLPQAQPLTLRPFGLMRYSDSGLKLKLRPGTLNGALPDNIYTGIAYNGTGTEYVKLHCVTSTFAITTATVTCNSTAPAAQVPLANDAPAAFDILIHVLVNNVLLSTLYTTNIVARPLLTYYLERTSPAAGAALYDLYYTWEIAAATVPA